MGQVEKSEIDQEFEPAGEARWPAAGAVLAAIVLTVLLPDGERVGPGWLLPAIEVVLLAAIVAGDPGRINRRSRLLRGLSIALVAVLVLGALSSTLLLIDALVHGGPETNSADALLSAGTTVWVSNNLAFALLYWELDGGGAAARAYRLPPHPGFAFPQQHEPRPGPGRLAAPVRRLPVPGLHQRPRLQPHRRHAPGPVGQGRHGASSR